MSKLSLDALKERAASTNQQELLNNVSGGTFGSCHEKPPCDYHHPDNCPLLPPFDPDGK